MSVATRTWVLLIVWAQGAAVDPPVGLSLYATEAQCWRALHDVRGPTPFSANCLRLDVARELYDGVRWP